MHSPSTPEQALVAVTGIPAYSISGMILFGLPVSDWVLLVGLVTGVLNLFLILPKVIERIKQLYQQGKSKCLQIFSRKS